ncbi:type ISP restriction/modification enzyme [Actinocatenispora sera]|uniref:type ISP restriction/modification enzyme n=1 Tax=Actinocatenispora sera TaxID=390989 RepID=UPI0033EE54B2
MTRTTGRRASSRQRFDQAVADAVARFGATVTPLLRARQGELEAAITAPMSELFMRLGRPLRATIRVHAQVRRPDIQARPDLGIEVAGALVGVVELKAPGLGVPGGRSWGKPRDREQFRKLGALPNVLYTDGQSWARYEYGELRQRCTLAGDIFSDGSRLRPADSGLATLLTDFLLYDPPRPRALAELIRWSAGLCRLLRDEVGERLADERSGLADPVFTAHLADWQEWLFPDLDDAGFADAYAQTVTFGLLLARRAGVSFELQISEIGERLAKRHLLVGRALWLLTARPDHGPSVEERSVVLPTLRRVIGAADWADWPVTNTYHELYEDFLQAYDPDLRRQTGSYYTPREVSDFITRFVDEVLTEHFGLPAGLVDDDVVVLDPAMGTGTFLQSVIDRAANRAAEAGRDVPAALRRLLPRMIGFEQQIGPYAVAELKLDQALAAHGVEASEHDMRLYVADTLGDPQKMPLPSRGSAYRPLQNSLVAANKVKADEDVMVVLGNPPYRKSAKRYGRWVLAGRRGTTLLDDFRLEGNGKYEYKLHDMAIYFWRWALWKAFESTQDAAGVVAFITTKAYLDGPGFAGMRAYLRRTADLGWIVDLSPEGHRSNSRTRVFPGVPHPVCVAIFARVTGCDHGAPARIRYLALSGTSDEKYERLGEVSPSTPWFEDCPIEPVMPLMPKREGAWASFPGVTDLLPLASLGITANRNWTHHPDPSALVDRWHRLIAAKDEERGLLLKETRDRTIDTRLGPSAFDPTARRSLREEGVRTPAQVRIGYRSFDRQYLVVDSRVVDYPRPTLWQIRGPRQLYLVTQLREPLTAGPAAVATVDVPDTHYLHGRGGVVIPMYVDADGRRPNVMPKVPALLSRRLGIQVRGAEVMLYVIGVVAHAGYTAKFADELRQPGVRVPLTADPELWRAAVTIGRSVAGLHGFGEWPADRPPGIPSALRPRVVAPFSPRSEDMPEALDYDPEQHCLRIGTGALAPVEPEVMQYQVSGLFVVRHWFDYRKRRPAGRRGGSPLDDIISTRWTDAMTEDLRDIIAVLTGCIRLEPEQADLLDRITSGPLITSSDLMEAGIAPAAT